MFIVSTVAFFSLLCLTDIHVMALFLAVTAVVFLPIAVVRVVARHWASVALVGWCLCRRRGVGRFCSFTAPGKPCGCPCVAGVVVLQSGRFPCLDLSHGNHGKLL